MIDKSGFFNDIIPTGYDPLPVRICMMLSIPGARGDFVAGWLGCLPGFLSSDWTIDCETGQSFVNYRYFKNITEDPGSFDTSIQLLESNGLRLEHDGMFVTCNNHDSTITKYFPPGSERKIIFAIIDVKDCDSGKIVWERLIKTHLTAIRRPDLINAYKKYPVYGIDWNLLRDDQDITDQTRIEKFFQQIRDWWFDDHMSWHTTPSVPDRFTSVKLNYNELFVLGGSRKLAQALCLRSSDRHHDFWDQNLILAEAPTKIVRFGHLIDHDRIMDYVKLNRIQRQNIALEDVLPKIA